MCRSILWPAGVSVEGSLAQGNEDKWSYATGPVSGIGLTRAVKAHNILPRKK